jgi:alpha-amylase/alpha-mannosidase (GH57 family)
MPNNLCIHGHFYQPPREDPLSGIIPSEAGTAPYSNWNEKIFEECYRPNIELGNFTQISFDIGPTLYRWLEGFHPDDYQRIIAQERSIFQQFHVSNALAQAYYHVILPLASHEDKRTQILWGLYEYQERFGHPAQGMWLPECGMDIETLEILTELGIEFTILAPWQGESQDLDVTHPYLVNLSNGKSISIFFYEGFLSGLISFDPPSTRDANVFIQDKLLPTFSGRENHALIMLSTDGELYGHHQPHREKFLAQMLEEATKDHHMDVTFPSLWLKQHPAMEHISLHSHTSWSCKHGVERWRNTCPCSPSASWKAPLRTALDYLAHTIDGLFLDFANARIMDPWKLRDEYIQVIMGRTNVEALIQTHQAKSLNSQEIKVLTYLLKAEDQRMKMFTSDAWFFEEFDRIELYNAIHAAAYAVWLVKQVTGIDLSHITCSDLRQVKSNNSNSNGEVIFQKYWQYLMENYLKS